MTWVARLLERAGVRPDWSTRPTRALAKGRSPSELLERGIAAYRARDWAVAESLLRSAIQQPTVPTHDRQVARNILGNLLERMRRPAEALAIYEANVAERPVGSYSYERLARLYGKLNRPNEAIGVLEQAIAVTEQQAVAGYDVGLQLARLRTLLDSARDQRSTTL